MEMFIRDRACGAGDSWDGEGVAYFDTQAFGIARSSGATASRSVGPTCPMCIRDRLHPPASNARGAEAPDHPAHARAINIVS